METDISAARLITQIWHSCIHPVQKVLYHSAITTADSSIACRPDRKLARRPDSIPYKKLDSRPDSKPDRKLASRHDSKPDRKLDSRADSKPDIKPASRQ
jgi:hypothetical protein